MTDDKTFRSLRGPEPYRGNGQQSRSGESIGDPLAELARLIGRSDPFAELGRNHQRAQQDPGPAPEFEDRHYPAAPQPLYGADVPRAPSSSDPYAPARRYPAGSPYRPELDDPRATLDPAAWQPQAAPAYQPEPDYQREWGASEPPDFRRSGQQPLDRPYDQSYGYPDDRPQLHGTAAYDGADHSHAMHARHDGDEQNYQYQDDAPLLPHEDETYDDAPRARGHGGLVTALALIGCAMLGTAGAYAYRSYSSPTGSAQSPPVIMADRATPTKIVPAVDPQSSKAVQDRVAAVGGGERLMTKQEEPVPAREFGTQSSPRVILPAPVAPATGASSAPAAANGTQPKAVRTVTIRPDRTDLSAQPVGSIPSAPPAPATTQRSAAAPAPTPPAPKAGPPAPRSGGPISLEANEAAPAPAPTRPRTAALPADTGGEGASGSFVVLSSQASESEAQSAFRTLQAKYPSELAGRQSVIRRVDLGSKGGVRYRTMVGPFSGVREASQFCATYKAAGGQCFLPSE